MLEIALRRALEASQAVAEATNRLRSRLSDPVSAAYLDYASDAVARANFWTHKAYVELNEGDDPFKACRCCDFANLYVNRALRYAKKV